MFFLGRRKGDPALPRTCYADGKKASGPPRGLFLCEWEMRGEGRDELWIQAPHYPSLQDRLSEKDTEEG